MQEHESVAMAVAAIALGEADQGLSKIVIVPRNCMVLH
jgi:hypothetical protein